MILINTLPGSLKLVYATTLRLHHPKPSLPPAGLYDYIDLPGHPHSTMADLLLHLSSLLAQLTPTIRPPRSRPHVFGRYLTGTCARLAVEEEIRDLGRIYRTRHSRRLGLECVTSHSTFNWPSAYIWHLAKLREGYTASRYTNIRRWYWDSLRGTDTVYATGTPF